MPPRLGRGIPGRTFFLILGPAVLAEGRGFRRVLKNNNSAVMMGDSTRRRLEGCPRGFAYVHEGDSVNTNRYCAPCGPGYFGSDGFSCRPCAPGTYQSEMGALTCEQCPEGEVSGSANRHCVMCPSGKHVDRGRDICVTCPVGTWSNAGDTSCSNCAAGTYNSRSGRPGCKECGLGYFSPMEGASSVEECLSCPKGFYCPYPANSQPLPCPAYHISPNPKASACKPCPWMFASDAQSTSCVPGTAFVLIAGAATGIVTSLISLLLLCPAYHWTTVEPSVLVSLTPLRKHIKSDLNSKSRISKEVTS
ncbi:hypothetical protein AAMO2058_000549400 [Amorphochlora amoebiformis]